MGLPHGQAGRQTLTCIQRALQRDFFSSFLPLQAEQTNTQLSRSLYSCVDFCVSVCFNLNGFQVPPLPKSASPFLSFDPAADIEAPLLSSCSLSLFPAFSQASRDIAVCHLSLSPLVFCSHFLPFPPLVKKQTSEISRFSGSHSAVCEVAKIAAGSDIQGSGGHRGVHHLRPFG